MLKRNRVKNLVSGVEPKPSIQLTNISGAFINLTLKDRDAVNAVMFPPLPDDIYGIETIHDNMGNSIRVKKDESFCQGETLNTGGLIFRQPSERFCFETSRIGNLRYGLVKAENFINIDFNAMYSSIQFSAKLPYCEPYIHSNFANDYACNEQPKMRGDRYRFFEILRADLELQDGIPAILSDKIFKPEHRIINGLTTRLRHFLFKGSDDLPSVWLSETMLKYYTQFSKDKGGYTIGRCLDYIGEAGMRANALAMFNQLKEEAHANGLPASEKFYKGYPNSLSGRTGQRALNGSSYYDWDKDNGISVKPSGEGLTMQGHMAHLAAITDIGKARLAYTIINYHLQDRVLYTDTDSIYMYVKDEADAIHIRDVLSEPASLGDIVLKSGLIGAKGFNHAKIEKGFTDSSYSVPSLGHNFCGVAAKTYSYELEGKVHTTACGYSAKAVDFNTYDFGKNEPIEVSDDTPEKEYDTHNEDEVEPLSTRKAIHLPFGIMITMIPYRPKPAVLLYPNQKCFEDVHQKVK